MNGKRRKQLAEAKIYIDKALDIIQDVLLEEEMAYDNLSEGLQCTLRGESMENNISELEEVVDYANEIINCLDNIE